MTPASSSNAALALGLVESLQAKLGHALEAAAHFAFDTGARPQPVSWLRDGGVHGGGTRLVFADTPAFHRASVNVSQVHYDDLPDKRLSSATALSAIVHPRPPRAPSMHMHISWTEMRSGEAYWRIMADLNPAIVVDADRERFVEAFVRLAPDHHSQAIAQGERYFHIPALDRHRGVAHFYLEGFASGDQDADRGFAEEFGVGIIDAYREILEEALRRPLVDGDAEAQLRYHTTYLFQVLTLDRGTTSGLLVHDQNDRGIMGSLPPAVDRSLLASWETLVPQPQDALVRALVDALPDAEPSPITGEVKDRLAAAVRTHYAAHPDALALQARGDSVPPTVQNHK